MNFKTIIIFAILFFATQKLIGSDSDTLIFEFYNIKNINTILLEYIKLNINEHLSWETAFASISANSNLQIHLINYYKMMGFSDYDASLLVKFYTLSNNCPVVQAEFLNDLVKLRHEMNNNEIVTTVSSAISAKELIQMKYLMNNILFNIPNIESVTFNNYFNLSEIDSLDSIIYNIMDNNNEDLFPILEEITSNKNDSSLAKSIFWGRNY